MKLIDTDIVIDHFHGHQATLDYFAETMVAGEILAISIVTLTELLSGMRSGEEKRTERLLAMFQLVDINEAIGRQAGVYLQQFRRSHHIELGDALIAATAAHLDAEMNTRNQKHYPMRDIAVVVPYKRGH
ncbi:MAG: type II toxin-antitoxin system VapC family toxin [Chloroflexota bacterium]|nr:type II toxin-antitoxin system VapC family toxin [Chloroflexota bacterium]